MEKPLSVTIIGIIFLILGFLAAVEVIMALAETRISINIGLCLGFVGYGLLKLKASSRKWAIRWLVFGYIALFIMLALLLSGNAKIYGEAMTATSQYILGIALIGFIYALMGWAHSILSQPDIVSIFEPAKDTEQAGPGYPPQGVGSPDP